MSQTGNEHLVTTGQLKAALNETADRIVQLLIHEMSNRFAEVGQCFDRSNRALTARLGCSRPVRVSLLDRTSGLSAPTLRCRKCKNAFMR